MASKIYGYCLCGQITYEYGGSVGPAGYCHCEDCRRCTGSAFNISVRFDLSEFHITSGSPRGLTKRGDSGNELTRFFCPECGSPIYTASPTHPRQVYVKAGTLDDPKAVQPARQDWVASVVPWSRIDLDIDSFAGGGE
ncbi:MAG: GFA family protein [bacterium]|nr:GFA family protein [bacterium]